MGQPQPSVLVIDDEELIRSLLVESLAADGYDVESAPNGEAALERLKQRRFDLAITDLKMPGMDGIETLRTLKQADRELQVVVMTGYASLETAVSALKGGACDYMEKPFKPTELAPVLQKAMSRSVLEGLLATYGASRVLIATMGRPELCRMIVDLAEGVFHADAVGLILKGEEDARDVHRRGTPSLPAEELLEALMGEADRLGRPYCLPSDDEEVEDLLGQAGESGAVLVYPLVAEDRPFGAICVFRRPSSRFFTEADLQRGILFASEATRALTSAHLKAKLDAAQSMVDRLRGQLAEAHRASLQGRLVATLARELGQPVRRLNIGIHFLQDAFLDFQEVISECRTLTEQLVASGMNQAAFTDTEERTDIGYLLEQTPRAIGEALDGATGISALMESIQVMGDPESSRAAGANLNFIVDAVIETVRSDLEKIAILEVRKGDLSPVCCHPGEVGSALLEILVNAADAVCAVVGDSGEKGRIVISTSQEGDHLVVTVREDGCGIRERMKGRVFEPWFSTRKEPHNNGLGLSHARRVIEEQHGGAIAFESSPGAGTIITVRLPVSSAAGC